eukprot:COSAG06_NODE_16335_length_1006_cov_25.051819_2_plen_31_part_01
MGGGGGGGLPSLLLILFREGVVKRGRPWLVF